MEPCSVSCGRNNPRGQIAIIFSLAIVALLGAVALGTDVILMYVNWQQAQKVADAAALAGANYLGGDAFSGTAASGCGGLSDSAEIAACTYAADNGFASAKLTITEPTATTIHVVAQESGLPYYFAKAIGLRTYAVSASATAGSSGPVDTVSQGLFPVGLQCNSPCNSSNLDPGQSVSFGSSRTHRPFKWWPKKPGFLIISARWSG